ncbi:MAG: AAC(3) family N-acetyltransferase [Gemmatimonadota bacterium]|nr:AAC(3) family N-acetyltransferase [Gemmatimonadota bacterium]
MSPAHAGRIRDFIRAVGTGPVFVHSDAFRVAQLVSRTRDRESYLDAHLALLVDAAAGRPLWTPAFNYDFPRTAVFDIRETPAQLGPLPERFRLFRSAWRTAVPIFSVAGTGPEPLIAWGPDTDPFGGDSIFARLVAEDGVILYYGDTFHYNTIVHYAERSFGPAYRYDKVFPGRVTRADGTASDGTLVYHVRPLDKRVEYDWPGILSRALAAGACVRSAEHPQIFAAGAGTLVRFLVEEMKDEPLGLLDDETRAWVGPALEKLGRRFVIEDFESVPAGHTL